MVDSIGGIEVALVEEGQNKVGQPPTYHTNTEIKLYNSVNFEGFYWYKRIKFDAQQQEAVFARQNNKFKLYAS